MLFLQITHILEHLFTLFKTKIFVGLFTFKNVQKYVPIILHKYI